MSVTFTIKGRPDFLDADGNETGEPWVNFGNANARTILIRFQLPGWNESQPCGEVRGKDLRELCEEYLANPDPMLEQGQAASRSGNFIDCGQRAAAFSRRVTDLLELARAAGDLGVITYG